MSVKILLLSALGGLSRVLARTPLGRLDGAEQVQFRLVEWLDPSDDFEVGSFRIRVDPRDRRMRKTLRLYGGYERYEVDLLRRIVSPGDVVVDAGAHVGLHTLWASRSAGSSGRVIAFEPDPDNRRLLERNLETNGVENVEVVAAALSDRTGEARLYQNPTDRANLSLRNPREFAESVRVRTTTLDEHFAPWDRSPDVLKVDVEGAEPLLLDGATLTLRRDPPRAVFTEVATGLLRAFGFEPADLVSRLRALGLHPFVIDEDARTLVPRAPDELLREIEGGDVRNLLWRRDAP